MADPRYLPITQQPYCCVPACIQMALQRRGLPLLSQEVIGKALGLTVPLAELHLLPHAYTDDEPRTGWGTRTYDDRFSLDRFFRTYGYRLRERYIDSEHLPDDLGQYIAQQIAGGKDVLACFAFRLAYGGEGEHGHVAAVESADEAAITLVDPWYAGPKIRHVTPERLRHAMRYHATSSRGGLWVIE